jgi:DNA-binding NarL/FixJ family response regulator
MKPIRLLLLDEEVLLREALGRLFESEPDFAVVAQCGAAAEALEATGRLPVDMVLLTLHSGAEAGYDFLTRARRAGYHGHILILTEGMSQTDSLRALQLGASGIFRKNQGLGGLLRAVRNVSAGEAWLDREVIRTLAERAFDEPAGVPGPLTERERHVLNGVIEGLTNKAIAREMGIPEASVKAALRRLFQRAGVHTRGQLIRRALENPLVAHK